MWSKRMLSTLVICSIALSLASCSNGVDESSADDASGNGYVAGNSDFDTAYYSSAMVRLPQESTWIYPFMKGDQAVFICGLRKDDPDQADYTAYVCNFDGTIESQFKLNSGEFDPYGGVDLGNGTFATTGWKQEYVIFDYEGNIVKDSSTVNPSVPGNDGNPQICRTEEGFAVCYKGKVHKFDCDCNLLCEIDASDVNIEGIFEQGGVLYGKGLIINGNYGYDCFYVFDELTGEITPYMDRADIDGLSGTDSVMLESNYQRAESCFMGETTDSGYMVELDMANKEYVKLANVNRIFVEPPTSGEYDSWDIEALDKTHFFKVRQYRTEDDGVELTEIALISRNDTLDMDGRERIVIQGAGIAGDSILGSAVYYYNMNQNDYYFVLDDINSRYGMNTASSMSTTAIQLIAQYSNGNAPDIFYGDFFDLLYLGECGLAIDMRPYLADSYLFDFDDVTPNIRGLMTGSEGEIYQVFAGYGLQGFWGQSTKYDQNCSFLSFPELDEGQSRFGNSCAADLAYDFIGVNLKNDYREGRLTYDNVLSALQIAVDNGVKRPDTYEDFMPPMPEDVGRGDVSLVNLNVYSALVYCNYASDFREMPVYVGYPSLTSSAHMISPHSAMAVSASSSNQQACCDFISYFMSEPIQRKVASFGIFPVNGNILDECLDIMQDPENASDELRVMYSNQLCRSYDDRTHESQITPLSSELRDSIMDQIMSVDAVQVYDWGVFCMIEEEINSYFDQDKSVEDVADSVYSRLNLYAQENYG